MVSLSHQRLEVDSDCGAGKPQGASKTKNILGLLNRDRSILHLLSDFSVVSLILCKEHSVFSSVVHDDSMTHV